MDYLDIESFRSKYSDITVTAVPAGSNPSVGSNLKKDEESNELSMGETLRQEEPPRVEITRVMGPGGGAILPSQKSNEMVSSVDLKSAATAYALEYKQVMDKLEHTRYMQAQLQLLTLSNGGKTIDSSLYNFIPSVIAIDPTANIVDKYSNLLAILAGMKCEITPTIMGARGPRERLLRDIAHARILVRECIMLIERDQQQQEQQEQQQQQQQQSE